MALVDDVPKDFDCTGLPDFATTFIQESELTDFAQALDGPGFVSLNDWKPVHQKGGTCHKPAMAPS